MDKYEFNIKVEQIKKLINKSDYETAMKIADTIDWRRVRNVNILSMVAGIYEKNGEFQEAKDILLLAFERAPIGKRLLYKLSELALKEGSIEEAEDYYKEFCDLAADDARQYILRYMILKAKGAPAEQLIHTLEQYCNAELDEKWMYELAELYNKAGMEQLCVMTCDKIMLMFGLGKYVDKAMELKLQYAPLNKYQMDLVENKDKYEAKLKAVEQEYRQGPSEFVHEDIEELKKKKMVFVAGGVGTAPVYPQVKWLHEHGITADVILGSKTKDMVILEKELAAVSNLYVTTDDGSYGRSGMVTKTLEDLVTNEGKHYDVCVAIGPMIMMKFVCLLTKKLGIHTIVSMNPIMVDGTGMCGACRLQVGDEIKFACVDGPEFDGHLVDFDQAMKRSQMYKTQEGRALLKLQEGDTHHGGCGHCGGDN